jgi:DNA-binding CsgD family transcriptional regulator/PAS domain-containing protein
MVENSDIDPRQVRPDGRFVAAVEEIYAAGLEPARWPDALQRVADCFDDVGTLLLYGRDDGQFGYIETESLNQLIPAFRHEYGGEDLRTARAVERGIFLTHDVATDRDCVSLDEIETHPFYRWLKSRGLKYFATAFVCQEFRVNVGVAVQRSLSKPPYSHDELQLLARLGRHVENALRLSVRLLNSELVQERLGDALGRLRIGVFALDSLGRVTFSNSAAERLAGDGLEIVDKSLRFSALDHRITIQSMIKRFDLGDIESSDYLKPILVHRARAERPLMVYILPISRSPKVAENFLTFARVIILIIDPQVSDPADPAMVRDLLGLTLGEARVAALVGSGVGPREAAARLGLTEETTRTTLKRVFFKTGISRQSELTALLTRLTLG